MIRDLNMTFKEYIKTRRVTYNPRGEFIKDARADLDMPDNFACWRELEGYLQRRDACEGAIKAAKIVWRQYRKYLSDNVN
jgi:hypothetical protein